ncbi:antibiotic biosynthesis monooxygenase [Desulfosporosinus sp. OT]|uniref:putative quinol monooxygenase n=1 Tax=Desulfosporosinus sp. OT TaxID=913865 RepID=UPI001FA6E35F|nr:antibiotic biosynthesis monooxygenase [Desulfosporosinus sp. OT]
MKKTKELCGIVYFTGNLKSKAWQRGRSDRNLYSIAKKVLSNEEDCLMYIPHVVMNDPTEIVFFEKYKDKEAFKALGSLIGSGGNVRHTKCNRSFRALKPPITLNNTLCKFSRLRPLN